MLEKKHMSEKMRLKGSIKSRRKEVGTAWDENIIPEGGVMTSAGVLLHILLHISYSVYFNFFYYYTIINLEFIFGVFQYYTVTINSIYSC